MSGWIGTRAIVPGELAPFRGRASMPVVDLMRSKFYRYTMEEIAAGFSVSRKTLYNYLDPSYRGKSRWGLERDAVSTYVPEDKFWARVDVKGQNDCWNWRGSTTKAGYARTQLGKKNMERWGFKSPFVYAYRIAYRLHHGSIDHALSVDHLCHNPKCCNPAHLRQCTQAENARRKWFHVLETRPAHLKGPEKFRSQVSKDNAPAPESSAGHISPLPDTDKHAPSDEGTSIPRRSA